MVDDAPWGRQQLKKPPQGGFFFFRGRTWAMRCIATPECMR
jgi:hypothetical protein